MAFFSISRISSSYFGFSPMYLKKSLKFFTLFWMSNILFWNYSSSLFVNLQRLSSYSSNIWVLFFLFSQISPMKRRYKQNIWKDVICDLKTTLALSLSTSSWILSSKSYGTAFNIHKTCRSSCSEKYASATSLNLWESTTDRVDRMLPKLGRLSLILASSLLMNLLMLAAMVSLSYGNFLKQYKKMEWMWDNSLMFRMDACFFSSMI